MAGQYDIFISGDQQAARELVQRVAGEQGYTTEQNPNGGLSIKRGSGVATAFLGGLAGKNLQITFFAEFFAGADNTLDVRLSRNTAASALKGGAIGAARTNDAFSALVNAVVAAAHAVGTYVNTTSV